MGELIPGRPDIKWVCACLGPEGCTRDECSIRKAYLAKQKNEDEGDTK